MEAITDNWAVTYDVAIIGGGPAGSTCASLLRKYNPELRVLVLERETFPRDRGVESPLPPVNRFLWETGVWDKVEAAGFLLNSGATYRWGAFPELWKLDLLVGQGLEDAVRPGALEGVRTRSTFHLERAAYDKILLDHAAELGAEVRQGTAVTEVQRGGDRIEGLKLADGSVATATWYVDASGEDAVLRSALEISTSDTSPMRMTAIWDEWENPAWSETVGRDGERAKYLSVPTGWLWFVPLGPTRASVGFVTHADYAAESGQSMAELFAVARGREPVVAELLEGASPAGNLRTAAYTPHVAQRLSGENWFLVGGAAGEADPILMTGLTLAQGGARELAYTILGLAEGAHDAGWLKSSYDQMSRRRLRQQVQFGDYWYAANGQMTELRKWSEGIPAAAGFELDANEAFLWLSHGGFAIEQLIGASYGFFDLGPTKSLLSMLTAQPVEWRLNEVNELKMSLAGAKEIRVPSFRNGKIEATKGYQKGESVLPLDGFFIVVLRAIQQERDAKGVMQLVRKELGFPQDFTGFHPQLVVCLEAIEALLAEGWLKGDVNKKRPFVKVALFQDSVAPEGQGPREEAPGEE